MKKSLKVALIVISAIVAVGGICLLVLNYISKKWLKEFELVDFSLDEEPNVDPEIEEV